MEIIDFVLLGIVGASTLAGWVVLAVTARETPRHARHLGSR